MKLFAAVTPRSICQETSLVAGQCGAAAVPAPPPAPVPAVIRHLLFEPTVLSSTGRRRFTLRNDTTGDLPVRWVVSEAAVPSSSSPPPPPQPLRPPAALGAASLFPAGAASPFSPSRPAPGGGGRDGRGGSAGTVALSRQGGQQAPGRGSREMAAGDKEPADRTRDGDHCLALTFAAASIPAASPSSPVAGSTADKTAAAAVAASKPDRGPFEIFPRFAVVPAHGEASFEVSFTPGGLGQMR